MNKRRKRLCLAWGREKVKPVRAFSSRSVIARVMEEGNVGACRVWHAGRIPPIEFRPAWFMQIDNAWRREMTDMESDVFFLQWCVRAPSQEKWDAVKLSRASFYRELTSACDVCFAGFSWPDNDEKT